MCVRTQAGETVSMVLGLASVVAGCTITRIRRIGGVWTKVSGMIPGGACIARTVLHDITAEIKKSVELRV